ncbi:MAG: SDR family NAD(P)-dependent oxidoreductase [Candidatus Gastranaerophilaceae bacterium]
MSKNVLITGASKGIGKVIAKKFADSGYNVFVTARNAKALEELIKTIPNIKGFYAGDLKINQNFVYEEAKKVLGNIDVLVNNAGAYVCAEIEKTSEEDIKNLVELNLIAPYKLTKLVIPDMKKQKFGRIINIGSVSGVVGEAYATLYSLTKSSFTGFSKALALEVAEYGITVNTIHPGWVDTELIDCENMTFEDKELMETIPQRRFIEPKEIAALALYLASFDAKGLTGQSINLCAGISMG